MQSLSYGFDDIDDWLFMYVARQCGTHKRDELRRGKKKLMKKTT